MYKKLKIFSRRLIQCFFVFLFFFLFCKTKYPCSEKLPLNFFFRIDPLLSISNTISILHLNYLFWPSLITIFSLILLGNFFCWWICPFGGIIDFINMILLRNKWRFFFFKTTDYIKKLRIFIFWGFIINSFIIIFLEIPNFFWFFDPYVILIRAFILKTWFIIFIMIIVINIFFPRIWCYTICPLGYLNYLLGVKLRNKIKKKTKWIEKNF